MKLSWLFNGTLEAHHLAAAYLTVWVVQGGYAGWVAWQWMRVKRDLRSDAADETSVRGRY